MKRTLSLLAAAAIAASLIAPASAKPMTVWEDATGDADAGQGLGASIPAGFDLVSGAIEAKGKDLVFTVTHADMPPSGTLPEGFRFLWAFNVGSKGYRWTFKSADIGKPDVAAGQTDERVGQVDAMGHFRLEGDCGSSPAPAGNVTLINCSPIGYYTGAIDAAAKTVQLIVPLKDIKAKPGSKIGPGGGDAIQICGICWVTHVAERSLDATIIDVATADKTYKIPKKK